MKIWKINIVTLFPDYFHSILQTSLLKKAIDNHIIEIKTINLKEFGVGKNSKTDDYPYGGGNGMILMIEPIYNALQSISEKTYSILLTPTGEVLSQKKVEFLVNVAHSEKDRKYESLTLICGRYEGIDARVGEYLCNEKISIGNYIVNGGEVAASVIIEATSRLIPNFMSNSQSIQYESFCIENQKEYPQYTRPANFKNLQVPNVLLSGNHKEIEKWRKESTL